MYVLAFLIDKHGVFFICTECFLIFFSDFFFFEYRFLLILELCVALALDLFLSLSNFYYCASFTEYTLITFPYLSQSRITSFTVANVCALCLLR